MAPIRTARQYKDFQGYAESLGHLERADVGTVEIETPFCGNFIGNRRSKAEPSRRTTGQYKDFQGFPDDLAI